MKFFKITILLIFVIFTLTDCINKSKTDSRQIDFPRTIHLRLSEVITDSINLSDIAEKVEYIPLQATDSSLLDYFYDFAITKNNIFIKNEKSILTYNKDGKFVNSLYTVGRGPEESSAKCFTIDEKEKYVYVYDQNQKVKIFDFNGLFIRTIKNPINASEYWTWSIGFFDNNLFISTAQTPNVRYLYSCFDLQNDSIRIIYKNYRQYEKSQENKRPLIPYDYHYQITDTSIMYKESFCDTIFKVNNDFVQEPRYIVDLNDRKLDWEGWRDHGMFDRTGGPPFGYTVQSFIETHNFLFLVLTSFKEPELFALYNKNTDSIKICINKHVERPRVQVYLHNDLDNLIAFAPMNRNAYMYYYSNCLYSVIEAKDFMAAYQSATEKIKKSSKYLKSMASVFNSIDEFSNPIIMKVYLK